MAFLAFFGGMVLALGLGLGAFLLLLVLSSTFTDDVGWAMSLGLVQWIYLVPLAMWFKKGGSTSTAAGLLVGGGLVFLLSSACWGLLTSI